MAKKNGATRVHRILKREQRKLPVRLTDPEVMEIARRAAALSAQVRDLRVKEESLKTEAAGKKKEAEKIDMERDHLEYVVHQGTEEREVEVITEADMRTGIAREVRMDTGEMLRERPMTADESQGVMFSDLANAQREQDEAGDNTINVTPETKRLLPAKRTEERP